MSADDASRGEAPSPATTPPSLDDTEPTDRLWQWQGEARRLKNGEAFGRYRVESFLGEGGTGEVYLATDTTLNRPVALKLLRSHTPYLAARFLNEARMQAAVDHPNVCKIHEAGELEGQAYIAMQHIPGTALADLAAEMSLEEKVLLLAQVAEALHEAHRLGLIHRDVTPNNILVERDPEGGWKPYVVDFGLAREAGRAGLTATGSTLGTPLYMSPEQARGDSLRLDRRADVYSLGAVLYEMLAGHPPFPGDHPLEVLSKVVVDEPPPLHARHPHVPADLESIAFKCLEKQPQRRYDSARALAEDLRRYLDGEAVLARRADFLYHLGKKVRKHRAVVTLVSALGLALVVAAVVSLSLWWQRNRRAELAQEFGHRVSQMEWLMRVAQTTPLHDLRPEQRAVEEGMAEVRAAMAEIGRPARGPGAYALGRAHLVLEEYGEARRELERALAAGYRTAPVLEALGLALGQLYERELRELRNLGADERIRRREHIETELRDPAMAYLAESRGAALVAPEYVEGLLAFYDHRFPEALEKARATLERQPWFHEAHLLMGEVHAERGAELGDGGEYEAAIESFDRAAEAFERALRIGESDPRGYEGLCRVFNQGLYLQAYYLGGDVPARARRAEAACRDALEADPERVSAHLHLANTHFYRGEHDRYHGGDPRPFYRRSAEAAGRAVELDPTDQRARLAVAQSLWRQGCYEQDLGRDPRPQFDEAEAMAAAVLAREPRNHEALNTRAVIVLHRAMYELDHGISPLDSIERGTGAIERALKTAADQAVLRFNLGSLLLFRGRWQREYGGDAPATLEQASRQLDAVLRLNPQHLGARIVQAETRWDLAEHAQITGGAPEPHLAEARRHLDAARAIQADNPYVSMLAARLELVAAETDLDAGRSPAAALEAAGEHLDRLAELNPEAFELPLHRGRLRMLEGRRRLAESGRGGEIWSQARAQLKRALTGPTLADAHLDLARLAYWQGRESRRRGREVDGLVDEGLAHADETLALRPGLGAAHLERARLLSLLPARREQALTALAEARRLNPHLSLLCRELEAEIHGGPARIRG